MLSCAFFLVYIYKFGYMLHMPSWLNGKAHHVSCSGISTFLANSNDLTVVMMRFVVRFGVKAANIFPFLFWRLLPHKFLYNHTHYRQNTLVKH